MGQREFTFEPRRQIRNFKLGALLPSLWCWACALAWLNEGELSHHRGMTTQCIEELRNFRSHIAILCADPEEAALRVRGVDEEAEERVAAPCELVHKRRGILVLGLCQRPLPLGVPPAVYRALELQEGVDGAEGDAALGAEEVDGRVCVRTEEGALLAEVGVGGADERGHTHVPSYTATKNIAVTTFSHSSLLSLRRESSHEQHLLSLSYSCLSLHLSIHAIMGMAAQATSHHPAT